jgi:multimeric flavodoxin WrbA
MAKRSGVPPVPEGPYVLVVQGSPRAGGNSDALAGAFVEGARGAGAEVVTLALRDCEYAGCRECHGCDSTGVCVWKDDFAAILPHLDAAAAVAVATPVFFMGTPSHLKAMIDRCQCVWARHWLMGPGRPEATRPGYLLGVSATDFGWQFDALKRVRDAFFLVLGLRPEGEALAGGIDAKGEAAADGGLLGRAGELGREAAAAIA